MNRKLMVWIAVPALLTVHVRMPEEEAQDSAAGPERGDDHRADAGADPVDAPGRRSSRATPAVDDQTEDLLLSADMQVVNDELRRRGFSPDIYFDYDESYPDRRHPREAVAQRRPARRASRSSRSPSRGTPTPAAPTSTTWPWASAAPTRCKDYLGSLGVAADRLRTISYGEERPVCTEDAESCWSQNRRAHMIITGRSNVG